MSTWKEIEPILKKEFLEKTAYDDGNMFHKYVKQAIAKKNIMLKSCKRFNTPQYILDEGLLLKRARLFLDTFHKHFRKTQAFYAFKCNDLPYALNKLKNAGINADVSGMFELKLALKLGFKKIIFTAPMKSIEELRLAIDNDVVINIDNLDELHKVIELSDKKTRISFRIAPENDRWSKFGLSLDKLKIAAGIAAESNNLSLTGIHFHSSWNSTPDNYISNILLISEFIKKKIPTEQYSGLEFIDIGGGFMPEGTASLFSDTTKGMLMDIAGKDTGQRICPDEPDEISEFAAKISKALNKSIFKRLELWAEPGRFIASMPTSILLKVLSARDRVIVDGGINLVGSADFKFQFFPIVNITRPSLELVKQTIYGPLCDPDDLWGYYYFGEKIEKGDILAVLHQGAYTFSIAWRFIRPTAPYTAFFKKRLVLAKTEETFHDRYSGCSFADD